MSLKKTISNQIFTRFNWWVPVFGVDSNSNAVALSLDSNGQLAGSSNLSEVVLASAARTATVTTADLSNPGCSALQLVINVTAVTATPSVVPAIQGKDANGIYYTILTGAAITGVSTVILRVGQGLTAAANLTVNDLLPRDWRVVMTHGDADSITYSVGANLIR